MEVTAVGGIPDWSACFGLGLHWETAVAEETQLFLVIFQLYQLPDWVSSLLCKFLLQSRRLACWNEREGGVATIYAVVCWWIFNSDLTMWYGFSGMSTLSCCKDCSIFRDENLSEKLLKSNFKLIWAQNFKRGFKSVWFKLKKVIVLLKCCGLQLMYSWICKTVPSYSLFLMFSDT